MNQCPSKDNPIEVTLEYEPTRDREERLSKIFELLLSKPPKELGYE